MTDQTFKAFVFDLDGTLVDTASELLAAYRKLCCELGVKRSHLMTHAS